ncbi:MAG TPA: precorrin-2 C(20)-methyltransferase [Polyangiaceae bacterium]|nr:precorrin-2 C(20)-methyltransferase [Polyangiaceae bacterium]
MSATSALDAKALGKLSGVGVGPGAPDLITLRALRVIQSADVIALPRSSDYGASVAWSIARESLALRPEQERLYLTFPMTKHPDQVRQHVFGAVDQIEGHLRAGRSVAFLTEGDPSVFSTFGYVRTEAKRRLPTLEIEVVPGVTSITSVAMVGGVPLADGHERVAIVPATYGVDDLVTLLQSFDTVVLMKLGAELPRILEALERTGLTEHAFYVSKATMPEQRIERDVRELRDEHGGCFSMLIIKRTDRSGLLMGHCSSAERPSEEDSLAHALLPTSSVEGI